MSKLIESFFEGVLSLLGVLVWCVAIYLICTAFNSDWNLKEFFSNSIKKETWIKPEEGFIIYPKAVDEKWVASIINNLDVKVKLRDPIKEKDGKIDFAFEVHTPLTRPVLKNPDTYKEVNYEVCLTFKFIDEDGFIIRTLSSWYYSSSHNHEYHERTDLRHAWNDPDDKHAVLNAILGNQIENEIVKRTAKIVYETEIKITKWERNDKTIKE